MKVIHDMYKSSLMTSVKSTVWNDRVFQSRDGNASGVGSKPFPIAVIMDRRTKQIIPGGHPIEGLNRQYQKGTPWKD